MGPEIVLLIAGGLGASGIIGWAASRRRQRQFVIRTRTEWVRAGQVIPYGPVGAWCYGDWPRALYNWNRRFGALGLTDGMLVFHALRRGTCEIRLRFADVRWIGVRRVERSSGEGGTHQIAALIVHAESAAGWRVYALELDRPYDFARELARQCGQPEHLLDQGREDFGPALAQRLEQDIYGQWQGGAQVRELYLAPDRLLFDWRDAIPLDAIRRLDVLSRPKGGLGDLLPLAVDLLRIEYTTPEGDSRVTGFEVRHGHQWAEAIAARAGGPLPIYAGRKKKEDDG